MHAVRPTVIAALVLTCGASAGLAADPARRPAVLVHSPRGQGTISGVDVEVLKDLHRQGLEVDYTDHHIRFTWDRIKRYNALVLYSCPRAEAYNFHNFLFPPRPPYQKAFVALIERYLAEGGGVLLMAYTHNVTYQFTKPLTDNWNAHIPLQHIEDPGNVARMTRMAHVPLGFTDRVTDSPVSRGVKQIWYPYGHHYITGVTNPLVVGPEWTVVVRAARTARTVRFDLAKTGYKPPENVTKRFPTTTSPPIFAIRPYKKGRVALCSMYPQFTFTSGRQWLFQGEVLDRGLKGKPSHLGKLLANTLHWLGEPSVRSGKLGGYTTDPKRLKPVNQRPEVRKRFEDTYWGEAELKRHRPAKGKLFRGLIGIKTTYSGATGTVADYARTARELGLDFIVLMDDFAKLTPAKWTSLKDECKKASDQKLWVLPGYAIDNNTGNHMFIYGPDPPWPGQRCLTGPGQTLLNQQFRDTDGKYKHECPVLPWILHQVMKRSWGQVGYYNFGEKTASAGQGSPMRMEHLRTYGMGVIWFYRDGKLVEDMLDHYLLTAQGNIPPAPGAVNIVTSPAELRREVQAKRGLYYAQARSLKDLQMDALRYPRCYDAPNVFPTTGPVIHAWPECWRVHTFAAEDFVTGRNRMRSPIHVTSEVGLKEIRIYDGTHLFRRFTLDGAHEFKRTLWLNGTVQRNLVLVADDVAGGRAVSYARRTRKLGDHPEFCGDRVNIGDMFMAHGPTATRVLQVPAIYGGGTWDGGPTGWLKLIGLRGSQPIVRAKQGTEGHTLFNQVPMLEAADEGVRMMRSVRAEVLPSYLDHLPRSPWKSYGPLLPSKLFSHVQQYAEWQHAAHKVHPVGHAGYGFGYGASPTLFTTRMTFKQDLDIDKFELLAGAGQPQNIDTRTVVGQGEKTTVIEYGRIKRQQTLALKPGDWVGVFSPLATNSYILTVRKQPMRMELRRASTPVWLRLFASPSKRRVKAGDTYAYELATLTFPVDADIHDADGLIRRKRYLENPTGLKVTGATRITSPGILDYTSDTHRIELEVPAPSWKTMLTLPFRCSGMNRRWSAGLWLREGYVAGHYGKSKDRYRPLGIDSGGRIYIPVSVDLAERHHIVAGHPVVADGAGKDLFIQVTQLAGGTSRAPFTWYVAVNNPSERPVTTTLRQTMALPGLKLDTQKVALKPGEHRVLVGP